MALRKTNRIKHDSPWLTDDGGSLPNVRRSPIPTVKRAAGEDWLDAISEYIGSKQSTLTEKGAKYYEHHSQLVCRWAIDQKISLGDFGIRHLEQYLNERRKAGISPATRAHDAKVLKNFMAVSKQRGHIQSDRFASYRVVKVKAQKKQAPGVDTLERILRAIPEYYSPACVPGRQFMSQKERLFYSARFRALIFLAIDTAARVSELLSIRLCDLPDLSEIQRNRNELSAKRFRELTSSEKESTYRIYLQKTKTQEPRYVPVSAASLNALKDYLVKRPKAFGVQPDNLLFCTATGGKVDYSHMLRSLHAVQDYAGIEQQIAFHDFRRFTISAIANVNLNQAMVIAGHRNPNTTKIYTTDEQDAMMVAHASVDPIGKVLRSKDADRMERKRKGPSLL